MAQAVDLSLLVPVKSFHLAKARLAGALTADERSKLARDMATLVVDAAHGLDVWVVCDDDEVASWARDQGAGVSWQPKGDLNAAVFAATQGRFAAGVTRVAVVHSDLPLVSDLHWLVDRSAELILVPDRHGTGTNVISTPTPEFEFTYGFGSFMRHVAEAHRLALPLRVVHDDLLGWDVDVPSDLGAAVDLWSSTP